MLPCRAVPPHKDDRVGSTHPQSLALYGSILRPYGQPNAFALPVPDKAASQCVRARCDKPKNVGVVAFCEDSRANRDLDEAGCWYMTYHKFPGRAEKARKAAPRERFGSAISELCRAGKLSARRGTNVSLVSRTPSFLRGTFASKSEPMSDGIMSGIQGARM